MSTAVLNHDQPAGHASAPPATAKFGMIMFLASEAMLFAGLIGGYIVLRLSMPQWPVPLEDGRVVHLPWLLTGINTVFLVASSFTLHFAEVQVKKGKSGLPLIFVTILLGSLFVGIQCYEWWHLHHEGLWFNTGGVFGSSFFLMTGFHGAHVLVGVLLILWCFLRQVFTRCFTPAHHVALENVSLYWHFVDVVWLFLFAIVYLWH
ncbi:MAG: cytochrome c oxidase subunit 3 [Terrimicrobiaceae bacterium]